MSYHQFTAWRTTPIDGQPALSIIIPTYNEAIRIIPTIGAIAAYVSENYPSCELIIADDGSTDETVDLVRGLGFTNLQLLLAEQNGGKGSAVRRGMLAARGDYLLFADADNSTPIEEIDKLWNKLHNESFDIAIGSRAAKGAEVAHKSISRQILSNGLQLIAQTVLGLGVKDTQCGFKMFTHAAAQKIYQRQTLMGFSFDLEILYLGLRLGCRIAEVPVSWIDAPGSKVNGLKEARRFLQDMMKIKLNDLRGQYV